MCFDLSVCKLKSDLPTVCALAAFIIGMCTNNEHLEIYVHPLLIVICIARLRNPTLTNRFAAETRQSRGRQRIS
jgi:hypothetical protein